MGEKQVLIVGSNESNGRALVEYLTENTDIECQLIPELNGADQAIFSSASSDLLVLLDSSQSNPGKTPPYNIALFNVRPNSKSERQVLRDGFKGMFYKEDSVELIGKGVDSILKGDLWFSRKTFRDVVVDELQSGQSQEPESKDLTGREEEILLLVASGAKNKEIAKKLSLSPYTIRGYISQIFNKVGVTNRLQATLWAVKNL
jgi:DNA-binding NarL/FixJ family response regulator